MVTTGHEWRTGLAQVLLFPLTSNPGANEYTWVMENLATSAPLDGQIYLASLPVEELTWGNVKSLYSMN
ncbi:MAG: hypothetical protein ACE5EO_02465 [Candidatus Krumholzibacteriia bacterium]